MKEPVEMQQSGAIHQNRAVRKTRFTPAHCYARPALRMLAGVSGTMKKMARAAAKVAAASTTKIARQESTDSAAASGAVDSRIPILPATIIQPTSEACRSGGYQVAMALSGDIRHIETPAPINARARTRPPSCSLDAKASAPQPAIARRTGSTRRGP